MLLKLFTPFINLEISQDLLFTFRGMLILDEFFIDFLIQILIKERFNSVDKVLNKYDKDGYTLFHYIFKDYSELYIGVIYKV